MGNAAGSAEVSHGRDIKETTITSPECSSPQKQMAGPKLPMPPEKELEERFSAALVSHEGNNFMLHVNTARKKNMWNMFAMWTTEQSSHCSSYTMQLRKDTEEFILRE